jgi:O-antigen/teichoic acid export membrane protein
MADQRPVGTVRRIFGNLAKLLGGKSAAGLLSLAYMAIAARALGPTDYGILILVHGFVLTVGGLIGWPGWHAVVRYGAEAIERDDRRRLARLLRFTTSLEAAGAIGAIVVAALLAPTIGPRLGWSHTAIAFAIPYSFAVLASMRSTPAGLLQLAGRFDLLGLHTLVAPAIRLIGAIVAVWFGFHLAGFLVAWLAAAIGEWAVMWVMGIVVARKTLAGVPFVGSLRHVQAENHDILGFMTAANADITFGELAGRIAPLVVGWVLGPAAAGLFAVAQRATTVISQMSQVLGQAAFSEFARLVAAGGRGQPLRRALVRSVSVALAAALSILLLLALFSREVATLLGGAAFVSAAGLMVWLAASRVVLVTAPIASSALIAIGKPGLSVTANLLANLGLLPLLPLFLLHFGLIGAGIQAVIQAAVATGLLLWFLWRHSADPYVRAAPLAGLS